MSAEGGEGCLVLVVAVTPMPTRDVLVPSMFVAAHRLYGSAAIDDIAVGPQMTGLVILTGVARAEAHLPLLKTQLVAALKEHGHPHAKVELTCIASSGSASIREAMEHWVSALGEDTTMSGKGHAYRNAISDLIRQNRFRTLYQPIINMHTSEVFAYEGLSRGPKGHPLEGAEALLDGARRAGLGLEVNETLAWLACLRAKQRFPDEHSLLFVNLDADQICNATSAINDWETDLLWPLDHTVVELTERAPIHDLGEFLRVRDHARHLGIRFALDDAGAGYSGLATWAILKPDFIKIDAGLTRGCNADVLKETIVSCIANLASRTQARVIVEGIETVAELNTVRELGVDFVQGFLFSDAAETPPQPRETWKVLSKSVDYARAEEEAAVSASPIRYRSAVS
jgi:EAL domain-containing protein (putative c-di-GMP-specific phosphodiesterase class I)